ncbi:DNA-binding protein [Streptomyces sp. NPDC015125]|uniref:DNA-binding protein n=1 Tax=Streptomyces sp. NPDC015125 TaxID=3364938 RepID=UPI0036FE4CB8
MAELARCPGLTEQLIVDLEDGRDWVDQHHILCSLASGLRLDPLDLTGQPYAPCGPQHAAVRAAAWQLRRHVFHSSPGRPVDPCQAQVQLRSGVEEARDAQAAGDEHVLALQIPPLLELADQLAAASGDHQETVTARHLAYVAAAGLLRRLGYRDLAWSLLQRTRLTDIGDQAAEAEEVRLLTSMGMPGAAGDRAEQHAATVRSVGLLCAAAFAHAAAGQRQHAEQLLEEAAGRVTIEAEAAEVTVARAGSAMQFGDWDQVLELEAAAASMPSARRADLLLLVASIWARRGEIGPAIQRLAAAEESAALYVRLDPLARELLCALRARARDAAGVRVLARMAGSLGMK